MTKNPKIVARATFVAKVIRTKICGPVLKAYWAGGRYQQAVVAESLFKLLADNLRHGQPRSRRNRPDYDIDDGAAVACYLIFKQVKIRVSVLENHVYVYQVVDVLL